MPKLVLSINSKFYVYLHVHPETKEIVYVGKGTAGRAWACGYAQKGRNGSRGNRTREHQQWLFDLLQKGFTPADFVQIVKQNLDEKSAVALEGELTEYYKQKGPLFNRQCYGRPNHVIFSPKLLRKAKRPRKKGLSYHKVATKLGLTTMTVWHALNGDIKGLEWRISNE